MLPQLDPTFFTSQAVWLFVCLAALVTAFKKSFIPRINASLDKRDEFIKKLKSDIRILEAEVAALEEKILDIKTEEVRRTSSIIKNAIKKSGTVLEEQLQILKTENEDLINGTRRHLRDEIKGLEQVFKLQIEITANVLYEKLFVPGVRW
jgi:F0F1-type ATP synthase membrane subunit b/b'